MPLSSGPEEVVLLIEGDNLVRRGVIAGGTGKCEVGFCREMQWE